MPDNSKFSNFANGGELDTDDIVVGLRSGVNTKFTYNGGLSPSVVVPIDQGGTAATNATDARTNLGVAIGSDVEAWDVKLDDFVASNLNMDTNTLSSTDAAGNIVVTPDTTGQTLVTNLQLATSMDVNDFEITNAVTDGNVDIDTNGTGLIIINSTTGVDSILDEDTMASNSATALATQQSIKSYVDTVAGGGFVIIASCLLGTTANLSGTYANGAAGVGATLTNNSTQVALTIDSVLTQVNDRILVKDQTAQEENGIYTVTTVGDGTTDWVLTRATDYDEAAEIDAGDLVPVTSGTINGGSISLETVPVATMGTDPIVFVIFAQPGNTFVTLASIQTITAAKTFDANVAIGNSSTFDINSTTAVNAILDEDNMSSDSATSLCTQQSIKAYVDALTGLDWTTDATGTIACAINNGYVCNAAGVTTGTLPATAAIGSVVALEGLGAGGWVMKADPAQTSKIGSSTTIAGGTLTSAVASDNVYVTCIVANTTWRVRSTNSAGLTIA